MTSVKRASATSRLQRRAPDHDYLELLEPVRFEPVFILGMHRSGTTMLYRLLQRTGQFNVVTLYHVARYDEVLHNHLNQLEDEARERLSEFCRQEGIRTRVIDTIEVDSDLPEEYGFILRNASCTPFVSETSLPKFVELCRKVQFVTDPTKPLLLKNPRDFVRFRFLHEKFPSARFIFIHRDPIQTIDSHLRAIRTVFSARSGYQAMISRSYRRMFDNPLRLWFSRLRVSARLGLDLKRVCDNFESQADSFLDNIGFLPRSVYHTVKYEDACADPKAVVAGVLDFLKLPTDTVGNYDALIRPRKTALLDEVESRKASLARRFRGYCQYCGYGD